MADGATYQTCSESLTHIKRLGFIACICSPYGYLSSPIELAFAFLKNTDLNADGLKCGKK